MRRIIDSAPRRTLDSCTYTHNKKVSDLVSHRAEATPELWREAMAVANGLRAPEAEEKGGEKDERAVRSDALFCTWPAEELAVRGVCGCAYGRGGYV